MSEDNIRIAKLAWSIQRRVRERKKIIRNTKERINLYFVSCESYLV